MAVYSVYRSAYEYPLGRRITKFKDKSLLDWFLRVWPESDKWKDELEHDCFVDVGMKLAEREGLGEVYGLWHLFESMAKRGAPPTSARELKKWLNVRYYPESSIDASEHAWQVCTDDDELELAFMMFDDKFLRKHPDRAEFLLWPKLRLPTKVIETSPRFVWRHSVNDLAPKGNGSGATYCVLLVIDDGAWLQDLLKPFRFKGVRLPDFADFLRDVSEDVIVESEKLNSWPPPSNKWRRELIELRKIAIEHPKAGLKKVLQLHGPKLGIFGLLEPSSWKRTLFPVVVQASQHFTQIAFRLKSELRKTTTESNLQWYFFDDVWAASQPNLAKSLLRYATTATTLLDSKHSR